MAKVGYLAKNSARWVSSEPQGSEARATPKTYIVVWDSGWVFCNHCFVQLSGMGPTSACLTTSVSPDGTRTPKGSKRITAMTSFCMNMAGGMNSYQVLA